MANTSHLVETVAPSQPSSRRHSSWRASISQHSDQITNPLTQHPDPHAALMLGHDHDTLARQRRDEGAGVLQDDSSNAPFVNKNASNKIEKMIAPYLAHHIPQQYNPFGGGDEQHVPANANTKYCYRHRPDMLCRKQADEPTMEQLQNVGFTQYLPYTNADIR